MIPTPKAIIFDCDGTLLLTADLHFSAISQAVELQGGVMPWAWYSGKTGLGRHDLFKQFEVEFGGNFDQPRLAIESIALTLMLAAKARPNPVVADLARRCHGQLPIAVATNSERKIVTAVLGATGLLDLFDQVVSIDDVAQPKPAPDMFLLAAQMLRTAPEDCLVLEDSNQGLSAAKAAGMMHLDVREARDLQIISSIRAS
jgi:HAD superfamily hydrolase (TIGR01509 family)